MKDNPQNRIKLSQLNILVAVAKQKNFSEAALLLGISQSAVSHAIASLEDTLGVVLFFRGRFGARLTPTGEKILAHASVIVDRSDAILKEAALAKGLTTGQVRIATFRSLATHVLPAPLVAFQRQFPGLKVRLTEHDDYLKVEQALREGQADIGLTCLPAGEDMTVWELLQDEFVVLLPEHNTASEPLPAALTWELLAAQPLIMPPIDDLMMRPVYEHINRLGYWLNVVNEIKTDATTVKLVAQGLGGTILPRLAAEPIPENLRVYSLPVPLARPIGVAILTDALQPPPVYALLETLVERVEPPASAGQ